MIEQWDIKYKTQKINDLIGAEKNISTIKDWLVNFYNENATSNSILIIGDHGVGKTNIITTILSDLKYNIKRINLSKIPLCKEIDQYIKETLSQNNIIECINEFDHQKIAIIIDELETVCSQVEKNFILKLQKINEEQKICPIIFISNKKHSKFISTLKNKTKTLYFDKPTYNDLTTLLLKICTLENINLENKQLANNIVIYSQSDYHKLLQIIQEMILLFINNSAKKKILIQIFIQQLQT